MKMFLLALGIVGCLLANSGCVVTPHGSRNQSDCTSENHEGCGNPNCKNADCKRKDGKQDECRREDDFSPFAVPVKPGHYVNGWNDAMRCNAKGQQFIVPRNSWFNGGDELGPEATDNLVDLAERLKAGDAQVLLEKEPIQPKYTETTLAVANSRTQQLNDRRRSTVVAALQAAGVSDANSRVHLDSVDELGTRGIEAPQVFNQIFSNGNRGGGGGGGQGGIGGGGGGQNGGGGGSRIGF